MNILPIEIQIYIYQFLDIQSIFPLNKKFLLLSRSNPIWKPLVIKKFGNIISTNYYESYKYQKKLAYKIFLYEIQWTLGCVGKITALKKPKWDPAIRII